jgi:uncharacterized protein YciI
MLYMVHGHKGPDGDRIRSRVRLRHLHYMIGHQAKVLIGGSVQARDGSWGGMMVVLDLPDDAHAQAWLAAEPYTAAGVFDSISIAPFRQMMPEPVPGLLDGELAAELAKHCGCSSGAGC